MTFVTFLSFFSFLFSQLDDNQLNGTIPDSIGYLTKLQGLYVSLKNHEVRHNSLVLLTFLSEICRPINWMEPSLIRFGTSSLFRPCMCHSHFHLSHINKFLFSHLFHNLCHNPLVYNLISSDLYSNQLSGTIPDSIGNLIKLQSLYVYHYHSISHISNDSYSHIFFHDFFVINNFSCY